MYIHIYIYIYLRSQFGSSPSFGTIFSQASLSVPAWAPPHSQRTATQRGLGKLLQQQAKASNSCRAASQRNFISRVNSI